MNHRYRERPPRQEARECARGVVSPVTDFSFQETCAQFAREVGASGCVITDFEELGSFYSHDCGDGRFRIYLEHEA